MPVFTMEVRPMRAAVERHVAAGSDVQAKLAASREGAGVMPIRTIRCPNCGFFLLNVFGQDHYYHQVKCQKCKFSETIDTALFRTMSKRRQKRLQAYCEEIGKALQR